MGEFFSRYEALGMDLPDRRTMCKGHCEGTGVFPLKNDDLSDPILRKLWEDAEAASPTDDGWHFVTCPDCNGTGKALDK